MTIASGDDLVLTLLRVLPPEVVEPILGKLDPAVAARLSGRIKTETGAPTELDVETALTEFFDLRRIADRPNQAGAYGPTGVVAGAEPVEEKELDPIDEVKAMPPERLARALDGEQIGTIALVLSCLEPASAGNVMKRLPTELRAEIALRMTKLGSRNMNLLRQLARAVAEKGRRLTDAPPELTADDIVTNLADMLRALPRVERFPVIRKLETADPDLAKAVLAKLSRIEDLLKIPDRQLQGLLAKLDVKTIAIALKNTDTRIRDKVKSNMSSRSRTVLEEESELLGEVPKSRIAEAQGKVLALVQKGEEDGEIVMEE